MEPRIAPKSDIICTVATGMPPRDSLPMMSATAACFGDMKMPVVVPDTKAHARNRGNDP